ncbi:DUF5683 domain-containing protein [Tenacibaculum sp. 190524A05c]|uniref:DUF5683 domain-containing protein n=1 Tax=Tenacibaculum platacis TaxID=3137852 RepID=A0ABP1ER37_9FLAO
MRYVVHIFITVLFLNVTLFAQQKDSTNVKTRSIQYTQIQQPKYDPLNPSRAAFYSAIFPGAGQIYNNRYWWQLPLIYGGMAASIYFYIDNNNEYQRFRTAFRQRKAGLPDEFSDENGLPLISDAGLESAQRQLRQNRDLSLLTTVLIYVLQIVEASVTAHLIQFDDTDSLTLTPSAMPNINYNEESTHKLGLTLKYSF